MPNCIHTPLTKLLNIEAPILCAPMAFASTGVLASAVTASGAFGLMGAGFFSTKELKEQLALIRKTLKVAEGAPVPIGIGFIGWILDMTEPSPDPRLEAILAEKPAVIWLAFGVDLGKYVAQIRAYDAQRDHKTIIFVIVNSVEGALQAANEWGVDVLVAQGIEAGGHGGSESPSLLTLLQGILSALPNGPLVVAAGGIATGQQVAALLTMGAAGVVLGTRFLFTEECIYSPAMKGVILRAGIGSTVRTLAFDEVGQTMGWPPKHDGRAVANAIMEDVKEGLDLQARLQRFQESKEKGESDRLIVWAGEGVGLTDKIAPAADVVRKLREDTEKSLRLASGLLGH